MALTTTYIPSFAPVNDAERIAAIASSNVNSLAISDGILHGFRGANTLGQAPNVATPTGTVGAPISAGVASALTSAANLYVSLDSPAASLSAAQPQDDGGMFASGTAIQGTTGSDWQPVGLAQIGNLTAG